MVGDCRRSREGPLDTPPKNGGYSGRTVSMFDAQELFPFVPSRPHLFSGRIEGPLASTDKLARQERAPQSRGLGRLG